MHVGARKSDLEGEHLLWQSCPRLLDEGLSQSGISKLFILSYETYLKSQTRTIPDDRLFQLQLYRHSKRCSVLRHCMA